MNRFRVYRIRYARRAGIITALLLVFLLSSLVRAEKNAPPDEDRNGIPDAVEETASGIVRVEAYVEDRDGNHRKVKSQTGFLLGDESAGYAITAYHDLIFSNDEIGKLKEEWSAGQEREVSLSETAYQIIYNGDIHKKAVLYEGSEGKDLAILRLDSPLSGELGLTLASEEEAVPEEVWIASYPEETSAYSESAVQFRFGPLSRNLEEEENPSLIYGIRTDPFSAGANCITHCRKYGLLHPLLRGKKRQDQFFGFFCLIHYSFVKISHFYTCFNMAAYSLFLPELLSFTAIIRT